MGIFEWIVLGLIAAVVVSLYIFVPSFRKWVSTKGKEAVLELILPYVYERAKGLSNKYIPEIAAKVVSGQLTTKEAVKAELYNIGSDLKNEVGIVFKDELKAFGSDKDGVIEGIIRSAADSVNPYPGKETSEAILKHAKDIIKID